MRKVYRYQAINLNIGNGTPVNITVRFISDGNFGQTIINIPGPNDPVIQDAGTVLLGTAANFRGQTVVCFSLLNNLYPPENEVRVEYYLNNTLLMQHGNDKSVEPRPIIVIPLKFS